MSYLNIHTWKMCPINTQLPSRSVGLTLKVTANQIFLLGTGDDTDFEHVFEKVPETAVSDWNI